MADLYTRWYKIYCQDPGLLEADLSNDIAINPDNVGESCYKQASLYSKWAILASIAETEFRRAKRHLKEVVRPQIVRDVRNRYRDTKLPSAPQFEDEVVGEPLYIQASDNLTRCGHILDIMKKAESALWQKKSMLEIFGYRARREEFSTPYTKKEETRTTEELESLARQILNRGRS